MIDINAEGFQPDFGHGTLIETSLIRYLHDEHVDLSELPPREVGLKYTDWGIADDSVFAGNRTPGDCVIHDPRDATAELGERCFRNAVDNLCRQVQEVYRAL